MKGCAMNHSDHWKKGHDRKPEVFCDLWVMIRRLIFVLSPKRFQQRLLSTMNNKISITNIKTMLAFM
jgi:hypothetical protein